MRGQRRDACRNAVDLECECAVVRRLVVRAAALMLANASPFGDQPVEVSAGFLVGRRRGRESEEGFASDAIGLGRDVLCRLLRDLMRSRSPAPPSSKSLADGLYSRRTRSAASRAMSDGSASASR